MCMRLIGAWLVCRIYPGLIRDTLFFGGCVRAALARISRLVLAQLASVGFLHLHWQFIISIFSVDLSDTLCVEP